VQSSELSCWTSKQHRIANNLLSFITYYIFHERYRSIEEEDTETEEEFQKRVEEAVASVRAWEWKPSDQKCLDIA